MQSGTVNWKKTAAKLTPELLDDWMAFDAIEGLGARRDDMRKAFFADLGEDGEPKDVLDYFHYFSMTDDELSDVGNGLQRLAESRGRRFEELGNDDQT